MSRILPLLVLAACSAPPERDPGAASRWSFDAQPPGAAPAGWRIESTRPQGPPAAWHVTAGDAAPSPPHVLALTDPRAGARGTFNLCWTDAVSLADVDVEVAVRAGAGEIDRGGGPAWRIRDRDNYYVARWNPLEDNFRVYYVRDGERVQLASAGVSIDADAWHVIRVRHRGTRIECFLDGERLLEADDATHTQAGGVGVWTKADAATSFDDLRATPAGAR